MDRSRRFGAVDSASLAPGFLALGCLALGCLALGCDVEQGPTLQLRRQFVVVRLALDPATEIGEVVYADPALSEPFVRGFAEIGCDGSLPLVLALDVPVTAGVGFGQGALFFATPVDARDLCSGEGAVAIQPISYEGPDDPIVQGPFYVDGLTIDGRLPIGGLPGGQLEHFPRWWRFGARMERRFEQVDGGPPTVELDDAHVDTVWPATNLGRFTNMDAAITGEHMLDAFVALGLQPDIDVDGDGLERFEDTDGDEIVDRCVEADGEAFEGADCPLRDEIADGYDLRLRFRVRPVVVTEW